MHYLLKDKKFQKIFFDKIIDKIINWLNEIINSFFKFIIWSKGVGVGSTQL